MKKTACISGIIAAVFLALFLSGWADADGAAQSALRRGNAQYAAGEYERALKSYEAGLEKSPDDRELNFNAAQAAYLLGDYEKAVRYYENSGDSIDKFLNYGNIGFKLGEALEDINERVECYAAALVTYREGIEKYPQDVPLKYNYELVKARLEELLEAQEGEGEGERGDGEEGEEQEGQSQDGSEGEQEEGQQAEEGEEGEQSEGQADESQDEDERQAAQEGEDGDDEEQESYSESGDESEQDREAIERILRMLESQENEGLKNNQSVVSGRDEGNGW